MAGHRRIVASADELSSKRGAEILEILKPVAAPYVKTEIIPFGGALVVSAVSGQQVTEAYIDWTFNTPSEHFLGTYYERWWPSSTKPTTFYLERAYFHLSCVNRGLTEQVLAVHAEPMPARPVDDNDQNKMATHIHINMSKYPLNKAHVCLELGRLSYICMRRENLSNSLAAAISMVRAEVLDHPDVGLLLSH
jgi:hypothetical protein